MVSNTRILDAIAEETECSGPPRARRIASSSSNAEEMSISHERGSSEGSNESESLATKEKRTCTENLTVILLMVINFRLEFSIYLLEYVLTVLPTQLQNNFRVVVSRTVLIVPDLSKMVYGIAKTLEFFIFLGARIFVFCTIGWIFFCLRRMNAVLEFIAVEVLYVDRWTNGIKNEDDEDGDKKEE